MDVIMNENTKKDWNLCKRALYIFANPMIDILLLLLCTLTTILSIDLINHIQELQTKVDVVGVSSKWVSWNEKMFDLV